MSNVVNFPDLNKKSTMFGTELSEEEKKFLQNKIDKNLAKKDQHLIKAGKELENYKQWLKKQDELASRKPNMTEQELAAEKAEGEAILTRKNYHIKAADKSFEKAMNVSEDVDVFLKKKAYNQAPISDTSKTISQYASNLRGNVETIANAFSNNDHFWDETLARKWDRDIVRLCKGLGAEFKDGTLSWNQIGIRHKHNWGVDVAKATKIAKEWWNQASTTFTNDLKDLIGYDWDKPWDTKDFFKSMGDKLLDLISKAYNPKMSIFNILDGMQDEKDLLIENLSELIEAQTKNVDLGKTPNTINASLTQIDKDTYKRDQPVPDLNTVDKQNIINPLVKSTSSPTKFQTSLELKLSELEAKDRERGVPFKKDNVANNIATGLLKLGADKMDNMYWVNFEITTSDQPLENTFQKFLPLRCEGFVISTPSYNTSTVYFNGRAVERITSIKPIEKKQTLKFDLGFSGDNDIKNGVLYTQENMLNIIEHYIGLFDKNNSDFIASAYHNNIVTLNRDKLNISIITLNKTYKVPEKPVSAPSGVSAEPSSPINPYNTTQLITSFNVQTFEDVKFLGSYIDGQLNLKGGEPLKVTTTFIYKHFSEKTLSVD